MTTLSGLRPLLVTGALVTATLTVSTVPALAADETCDGKPATIVVRTPPAGSEDFDGTPGDDVIVVTTPAPLTVNGLGGDDTICGAARTSIRGGEGGDVILSGDGQATLEGGAGKDTIQGGGAGLIQANGGDDKIFFSGAYDIDAGKGDDRIRMDDGEFVYPVLPDIEIKGNRGTDWVIDVPGATSAIDLRRGLKLGTGWLPVRGVENARQVENPFSSGRTVVDARPERVMHITGTAGPNVLTAPWATGKYPVALHGLAGNDRLLGGSHVTAYGGSGRDFCRAEHRRGCERR